MTAELPSQGAARAQVIDTARGPIEVAVLGSGPALLIAHGMPGRWEQAVAIARDLEAERTVVLVTRPGYGGTPLRSGRSAADQADLFAALLDALDLETTTIVGISGGGPSALAFAQRHPDRTTGLVLLCALAAHVMHVPGYAKVAARLPGGVWGTFVARERRNRRRMLDDPKAFDTHLRADLTADELARFDVAPSLRDDYVAFLRSQCTRPSWAPGFRNDVRAIMASGVAPTDAITAPTLVVHGDADTVVPIASAEHHASAVRGARLHVLPGGTHGFPLLDRATTVDLLRSMP